MGLLGSIFARERRERKSAACRAAKAATQPDLTTQYTVVRSRTIFEPAVYVGLGASDNSHQLELSLNRFGVFYLQKILVKFPDPRTASPIMTFGAR